MAEQKYTVNAMGEQCPIPVVKTKKVLDSVQGDAEITVLVDNETAVQNLTRMGRTAGAEVLAEKKSDREFHVILRVKDRQPATGTQEEVTCIPDAKGDFVIAVDTATMGRGNDELGKVLMKGFLTVNGLGERCGNAPLASVQVILKDMFEAKTNIIIPL